VHSESHYKIRGSKAIQFQRVAGFMSFGPRSAPSFSYDWVVPQFLNRGENLDKSQRSEKIHQMTHSHKLGFDRLLLTKFLRGAQKVFANAEALNGEARILAGAGATSRALFLHQISLEECAKIQIIGRG
jgi:hypothetical protein